MTCIVVDDEPLAREWIELLVQQTEDLHLIGSFNSARIALDFLNRESPDLIFMDIRMPDMDGLEFARLNGLRSMVVFTTAYAEHALDSYELQALDYLMKPVRQERFKKTVLKASSFMDRKESPAPDPTFESNSNYFYVRSDRKVMRIGIDDLLYVEGLKDYVILHTTEQKIFAAMNIKTIYDQLPAKTFFRISKSFIVNVNKISAIENSSVMVGGNEIPIGNAYRNVFFERHVNTRLLGRR